MSQKCFNNDTLLSRSTLFLYTNDIAHHSLHVCVSIPLSIIQAKLRARPKNCILLFFSNFVNPCFILIVIGTQLPEKLQQNTSKVFVVFGFITHAWSTMLCWKRNCKWILRVSIYRIAPPPPAHRAPQTIEYAHIYCVVCAVVLEYPLGEVDSFVANLCRYLLIKHGLIKLLRNTKKCNFLRDSLSYCRQIDWHILSRYSDRRVWLWLFVVVYRLLL